MGAPRAATRGLLVSIAVSQAMDQPVRATIRVATTWDSRDTDSTEVSRDLGQWGQVEVRWVTKVR